MADFNWYLNKQGARGVQGEKGLTGYSPYITVNNKGNNEVTLSIHNENETLETPNLKANLIDTETNPDGTYVRYNKATRQTYIDTADEATTLSRGEVILATVNDIVIEREPDFGDDIITSSNNIGIANESKAVTPAALVDSLSKLIVTSDGNLSISQNNENSLTEIKLADKVIHKNLFYNSSDAYLIRNDLGDYPNNPVHARQVSTPRGTTGLAYELLYNDTHFSVGNDRKLNINSNIVNSINNAVLDINNIKSTINSLPNKYMTLDTIQLVEGGIKIFTNDTLAVGYEDTYNTVARYFDARNMYITYNYSRLYTDYMMIGTTDIKNIINKETYVSYYDNAFGRTIHGKILHQGNILAGDNVNVEVTSEGVKIHATGGGGSSYVLPIASASTLGGIKGGNWLTVNQSTGKLECGELSYTQYQNALGYTFISKTTLENRLAKLPTGGATIDDEDVSTTKVFSSSKTSDLIGEVGNDLQDLSQRVDTIESLKVPNVVRIGNPMIVQGQVSDLDENNHLQFPFIIERKGRPFTCYFEFTTGADITRQQNIIDSKCSVAVAVRNSRLVGALSTNGTTFNLGERTISNFVLQPYTTYYCKLTGRLGVYYYYDLSIGINENERDAGTYSQSWQDLNPIYPTTMTIGSDGNSFDGVLDLNKWSLEIDGELAWQGMDDVGLLTRLDTNVSNVSEIGKQTIKDMITELNPIQRASGDLTCDKPEYFATSPVHLMSCNGRQYYKNNDKPALMAWILKEGTAWGGGQTYFNIPILVSNDIEATYQHCVQGGDPNYGAIEEFDYKGVHWYVTEVSYAWEYNYSVAGGVAIKFGDTYPNLTTAAKELIDFTNAKMDNKDVYQFYTKEEIDEKIGDIGTILDNINGEDIE